MTTMSTGDAVRFVVEVSQRLADESDYDDELWPKFIDLLDFIDPQGEEA
ncbi:MAG: hypothetical protein ACPHZ7_03120 [Vibrio toranzoniae]